MIPRHNKLATEQAKKKYDLTERTTKFGEGIIEFCKELLNTPINQPLISQLIRAGTSIGVNYMEADGAESKKIFNKNRNLQKGIKRNNALAEDDC